MVEKEMRREAKRRIAGLSRTMLGLVKREEDDDGFFRDKVMSRNSTTNSEQDHPGTNAKP